MNSVSRLITFDPVGFTLLSVNVVSTVTVKPCKVVTGLADDSNAYIFELVETPKKSVWSSVSPLKNSDLSWKYFKTFVSAS